MTNFPDTKTPLHVGPEVHLPSTWLQTGFGIRFLIHFGCVSVHVVYTLTGFITLRATPIGSFYQTPYSTPYIEPSKATLFNEI